MERLTARIPENNMAYLVKVKPNEQEVESPYPNTLEAIVECFQCLAAYEDSGLTPEQVQELAKAKAEGRLVVLPYPVGVHLFALRKGKIHEFEYTQYELWRDSEGNIKINLLAQVNAMAKEEMLRCIGKTVFLTREAAEKALWERLKNDKGEV